MYTVLIIINVRTDDNIGIEQETVRLTISFGQCVTNHDVKAPQYAVVSLDIR